MEFALNFVFGMHSAFTCLTILASQGVSYWPIIYEPPLKKASGDATKMRHLKLFNWTSR
jgi:hypothetical protein